MILAALARYSAGASLYTPFGRGILDVLAVVLWIANFGKGVHGEVVGAEAEAADETRAGGGDQVFVSFGFSVENITDVNRYNGLFHSPNGVGDGDGGVGITASI